MSSPFLCPHCRGRLQNENCSLRCEKGHCFDLASEGYINLAVGKNTAGDSAEMCRARRDFLASGAYRPFAEALTRILTEHRAETVCDAGCGEGFYLRTIKERLPHALLVGLDLAKTSIKLAAKAEKGKENPISYAVAGIFAMPLPDTFFDAVLSVFAPVPDREAYRILKNEGLLVVAHPGKNHLMGLKRLLYQTPYENEEKELLFDGFKKLYDVRTSYTAEIEGCHLQSLFLMTPYAWRTSKEDAAKLTSVSSLVTELDFLISVYQKQ